MLVKIGKHWVRPERVDFVSPLEDDIIVESVGDDGAGNVRITSARRETIGTVITFETGLRVEAEGVDADEAASRINACCEQMMAERRR